MGTSNFKKQMSDKGAKGFVVGGASSGGHKTVGLKIGGIANDSSEVKQSTYPSSMNPALLAPRPSQQRSEDAVLDTSDIDESISERGVDQALIVRPSTASPGQFEIISGERRWRSAMKNGLTSVPVIVRECDDFEFELIQWSENNHRKDLSLYDQLIAVKRIWDMAKEKGQSEEEVRKVLSNGSKSWLSYRLTILNGPEEVLFLSKKESDLRKLYELAQLAKTDSDLVLKLVSEMEKGVNVSRDDILKIKKRDLNSDEPAIEKPDNKTPGKTIFTEKLDDADQVKSVSGSNASKGKIAKETDSKKSHQEGIPTDVAKTLELRVSFDGEEGTVVIALPKTLTVKMSSGLEASLPVEDVSFIQLVQ